MAKLRYWGLLALSAVFAGVTWLVLAFLEYGLPLYVPLWVYGIVCAFCYALVFVVLSEHHPVARFAVPIIFSLGLVLLFGDTDDSPQALMRQLHRVQPGMNVTQVEAIMGRYNHYNALFGIENTKHSPSGQLVLIEPNYAVYKHSTPDDGAYNAAHGTVHFKNGRVTGVSYIGD